jgi:hypothetical protein
MRKQLQAPRSRVSLHSVGIGWLYTAAKRRLLELEAAYFRSAAVLAALLLRFSRTAEPSFATLILGADSPKSYRVTGARISGPNEPVRIGMRFEGSGVREFSILSQRVKALNNELHQNRVARLQPDVRRRQTLNGP